MSSEIDFYKVGRAIGNVWSLLILAKHSGRVSADTLRELEEQLDGLDDNILSGSISDADLIMSTIRAMASRITELYSRSDI